MARCSKEWTTRGEMMASLWAKDRCDLGSEDDEQSTGSVMGVVLTAHRLKVEM
jgi:hypothetical protein